MTAFWQDLLQQHATDGAAYTALAETTCFMPLDHLGVLSVSGNDAQTFLQSLLSNDITLLDINGTQYSSLCTPKGRLLALFLIIRIDDNAYQLVLTRSLCEAITKRLIMYILRSKVTVSNVSDTLACLGSTHSMPSLAAGLHYHVLPTTTERGVVICPIAELEAVCQSFIEQQYQPQLLAYWQWLDIIAGIAKIVPETQEKFTPQQLNLDITHAVNFQKGCYPGQEVVARLHYLGKASRRLFSAEANTSVLPETGSEVMTAEGKVAGHIVSTVQQGEQDLVCLISLKLSEYKSDLQLGDTPLRLTSGLVD